MWQSSKMAPKWFQHDSKLVNQFLLIIMWPGSKMAPKWFQCDSKLVYHIAFHHAFYKVNVCSGIGPNSHFEHTKYVTPSKLVATKHEVARQLFQNELNNPHDWFTSRVLYEHNLHLKKSMWTTYTDVFQSRWINTNHQQLLIPLVSLFEYLPPASNDGYIRCLPQVP